MAGELHKLIQRLGNIRIAGFRLKLGYRRKHLHEDMWQQDKEALKKMQNLKTNKK